MATRHRSSTSRRSAQASNGQPRARKPRASVKASSNGMMSPMLDGMAEGIMNRIKNLSDEAVHVADAGVRGIRNSAGAYVKAGRKRAGRLERSFEHRVEERPLMAVLAASIIGFVLGIIFARR